MQPGNFTQVDTTLLSQALDTVQGSDTTVTLTTIMGGIADLRARLMALSPTTAPNITPDYTYPADTQSNVPNIATGPFPPTSTLDVGWTGPALATIYVMRFFNRTSTGQMQLIVPISIALDGTSYSSDTGPVVALTDNSLTTAWQVITTSQRMTFTFGSDVQIAAIQVAMATGTTVTVFSPVGSTLEVGPLPTSGLCMAVLT